MREEKRGTRNEQNGEKNERVERKGKATGMCGSSEESEKKLNEF
jgi:hypothetical protein